MTKLQKNQLLVLKPVDGSFEPEYFIAPTNALISIPKCGRSIYYAINNNIPFIYNNKICKLSIEDCSDIEWGKIERILKEKNHTTRGLHNKLYKITNLNTGETKYIFRAKKFGEIYNINDSTICNWNQLKKYPVKKIINDQVYEINRVDGENVKLKDIIL